MLGPLAAVGALALMMSPSSPVALPGDRFVRGFGAYAAEDGPSFVAQFPGHALRVQSSGLELWPRTDEVRVMRVDFLGAALDSCATGAEPLPGLVNYYAGNESRHWDVAIQRFATISFEHVYPGVDVVYHSLGPDQLEFDLVVRSGAQANGIVLGFSGTDAVELAANGDLLLVSGCETYRLHRPVAYQRVRNQLFTVPCFYKPQSRGEVALEIGGIDRTVDLLVDPVLEFSSYFGGTNDDGGYGVAVDPSGNFYVSGRTWSPDFPRTTPISHSGGMDAFVSKFDPSGALVFSTLLGGSGDDNALRVQVDAAGNILVAGLTSSSNFPLLNAFQAGYGGGTYDGWIAKLDPSGLLVFSSYIGGAQSESIRSFAVSPLGEIFLGGDTDSVDLPVLSPRQASNAGSRDLFLAHVSTTGALLRSTYFGGTDADTLGAIELLSSGRVAFVGETYSTDFPILNAAQSSIAAVGSSDGFVAVAEPDLTALVFSTYYGGSQADGFTDLVIDSADRLHVAGSTRSTDIPIQNALQSVNGGLTDVLFVSIDTSGMPYVSSYWGGSSNEVDARVAYAPATNEVVITGTTQSTDFPLANPLRATLSGARDAFLSYFQPGAPTPTFSTFYGGDGNEFGGEITATADDQCYVVGFTASTDFPLAVPYQSVRRGVGDAYIARLGPCPSVPTADAGDGLQVCAGEDGILDASRSIGCLSSGLRYQWLEGATVLCGWSVDPSCLLSPARAGVYTVEVTCGGSGAGCASARASVSVEIIPDAVPGDLGNSIRMVRAGSDVALSWASAPTARSYNLYRSETKGTWPFPHRTDLATTSIQLPDVAVPPNGPRYFYRATGVSCSGIEGL